MQRDCYRCGHHMEEALAFCSSCGAPQVRVTRAPENPPSITDGPPPDLHPAPTAAFPVSPDGLATRAGIDWKHLLRKAAPLAALSGMLTVALPLLGLFVVLPASSIWTISRYRQNRPDLLRTTQGVRIGTFMGLLSFGAYLCFKLADILLNQAKYRETILNRFRDLAAQSPDPQSQQVLQWFATSSGLWTFTVMAFVMILVVFLIVGMGSGALAVALGRTPNRPQV